MKWLNVLVSPIKKTPISPFQTVFMIHIEQHGIIALVATYRSKTP